MIGRAVVVLCATLVAAPSLAAEDLIDVIRGPDTELFGSCVPSLIATNRSPAVVDYVQVDLEIALRDGRTHLHAFRSSYREGVARPIAPGATRALMVHGDESQPLKASCAEIVSIRVLDATCEVGAKPCGTTIAVKADR